MLVDWQTGLTLATPIWVILTLILAVSIHETTHVLSYISHGEGFNLHLQNYNIRLEPHRHPPRRTVVITSLAPAIPTLVFTIAVWQLATLPLSITEFLMVTVAYIGLLPSPADVKAALWYDPETADLLTEYGHPDNGTN